MAYQTLKQKLFAAALLNPGLVNILGGGSPLVLRWYDTQLNQTANAGLSSVVVRQITNPQMYVTTGRLPTSFAVMRFECYGAQSDAGSSVPPDSVSTDLLVQALMNFLDTFNGDGITGRQQSPCQVLSDREDGIPQMQPLVIRRVVDVRIFWNGQV